MDERKTYLATLLIIEFSYIRVLKLNKSGMVAKILKDSTLTEDVIRKEINEFREACHKFDPEIRILSHPNYAIIKELLNVKDTSDLAILCSKIFEYAAHILLNGQLAI